MWWAKGRRIIHQADLGLMPLAPATSERHLAGRCRYTLTLIWLLKGDPGVSASFSFEFMFAMRVVDVAFEKWVAGTDAKS